MQQRLKKPLMNTDIINYV